MTVTHRMLHQVRTLKILWWVALVAVCLPIILVKSDVWDGVIGAYGLARNDFSGIREWLIPSNWGLAYLMLRAVQALALATSIPPWIWVKLLLIASVVGLSCETRLLCRRVLGWGEGDSRLAALLALSFPCWYVLYGSTFIYLVFMWAVFAGHRFLHEGATRAHRLGGFVLMLLSFQVNSNLVMIFCLEAVRWLYRPRAQRWHWGRSALIATAAVVVYLALRLVWTPSGPYAGYNNLVWPFSEVGARTWLRAMLMATTWLPLLLTPAAAAWVIAETARVLPTQHEPRRRELAAIVLLLAGGLFAYMAVGKGAPLFVINLPVAWLGVASHLGKSAPGWLYTTADGWSMRNAFLFSVPAAIAGTGLIRWVLHARGPGGRTATAWYGAVFVALAINLALLANGHAAKQLRAAQEESIVRALRGQPAPPSGTVDIQISPAVGWSVWTYEANYWLWRAYGRAAWAAAAFTADPLDRRRALADREQALASTLSRAVSLMDEAGLPGCHSAMSVQLPDGLGPFSYSLDLFGLQTLAPARLAGADTRCALR